MDRFQNYINKIKELYSTTQHTGQPIQISEPTEVIPEITEVIPEIIPEISTEINEGLPETNEVSHVGAQILCIFMVSVILIVYVIVGVLLFV